MKKDKKIEKKNLIGFRWCRETNDIYKVYDDGSEELIQDT
jgi:hypothetical protein